MIFKGIIFSAILGIVVLGFLASPPDVFAHDADVSISDVVCSNAGNNSSPSSLSHLHSIWVHENADFDGIIATYDLLIPGASLPTGYNIQSILLDENFDVVESSFVRDSYLTQNDVERFNSSFNPAPGTYFVVSCIGTTPINNSGPLTTLHSDLNGPFTIPVVSMDDDGDGISNEIDLEPTNPNSARFSDVSLGGSTFGHKPLPPVNDGQIFNIIKLSNPDGIQIEAKLFDAGNNVGIVPLCGEVFQDEFISFRPNRGNIVNVNGCNPSEIKVIQGTIEFTFVANGIKSTTILDDGDSLSFNPETVTFNADSQNTNDIIISVINDGQQYTLQSDQQVIIPPLMTPSVPVISGFNPPSMSLGPTCVEVFGTSDSYNPNLGSAQIGIFSQNGILDSADNINSNNGDWSITLLGSCDEQVEPGVYSITAQATGPYGHGVSNPTSPVPYVLLSGFDSDLDTVDNVLDVCPGIDDTTILDTTDTDNDAILDACDADDDNDGIIDDIDLQPLVYSQSFLDSDGTTGTIVSGQQFLTIIDVPGSGIYVTSTGDAIINACGIAEIDFTESESKIICGSISIQVIEGSLGVTYTAEDNTISSVTLNQDDDVTFDEAQSGRITNNGLDVIDVLVNNESNVSVPVGKTIVIDNDTSCDCEPLTIVIVILIIIIIILLFVIFWLMRRHRK